MKEKKPIYKRVWFIVLIIIVAIAVVLNIGGGDSTSNSTSSSQNNAKSTQEKIAYKKYSVKKIQKDLETNALNAQENYKDQYVALTGKLSNIDSSGDYISISGDEYSFTDVMCYIQDDKQLEQVKKLSTGTKVVVKGQITDVGEVLGYSMDIHSISKAK